MNIKAFIDTNVLLDWLLKERPEKLLAEKLFSVARAGLFDAFISTQSIIDASYSAQKCGLDFASFKPALQSLRSFITVLAIDDIDLSWAVEHYTGDFEDDAQYASAYNNACDYFITRDNALFSLNTPFCPMKVISPEAFVSAMSPE